MAYCCQPAVKYPLQYQRVAARQQVTVSYVDAKSRACRECQRATDAIARLAQHAHHAPAMLAAPSILPVASQRVVEDIRGRQRRGAGCREGALHRELYPAASATSIHDRLSDPGKLPTPGGQPSGVFLCAHYRIDWGWKPLQAGTESFS